MGIFKIGDKVVSKSDKFIKGTIKSVNTFGFLAYQVKVPKIGMCEYHKGELRLRRK